MADKTTVGSQDARERLFRLAFQDGPEAVAVLDAGGAVLAWSRGAADLLGWGAADVVGRPFAELSPPGRRAEASGLFAKGGAAGFQNMEWTLRAQGGGEARVLLTALRTSDGGAPGPETAVWIRPASPTGWKELQDPVLRDMVMRMQQLGAVGQIAAALSHQIRTPLHVIQSTVEFIEDQLPQDSPHLEGLRVVDRNIERITSVVDSLRSFTRYKAHAWAPGDLTAVVDRVCLFMEMVCKRQGVRLHKSLSPLPPVSLDADYLLGALYNLMGNAVEAMPEGGVLTVTVSRRDQEALVVIQDTGPGMDPAVLERVGSPFFTTKASGTGLGLFVVREVLDQHRARLQIESKKGAGTRVLIAFPLA